MKIDTKQIEGYDNLTLEEKIAKLEAFEIETPKPDYTGYVKKEVFDKTASDLSKLKKEQLDRLSEDEKAKKLVEEELSNLKKRNEELERTNAITGYKAKYLALGYDDELATATAQAFADGDMDTVFSNQTKFLEEHDKAVKASLLGKTKTPPAGNGGKSMTKEEIMKIKDTQERQKAIAENRHLFG